MALADYTEQPKLSKLDAILARDTDETIILEGWLRDESIPSNEVARRLKDHADDRSIVVTSGTIVTWRRANLK